MRQWVEDQWDDLETRLQVLPGKKLMSRIHPEIQRRYGVSFGNPKIAEGFTASEIPPEIVDLLGRIALCQSRHQQTAEPQDRSDPDRLALLAYVTHQSRGLPIMPDEDPRLAPARARGEALFSSRMGQLNLSCAQCHDDNAGGYLAAARIPAIRNIGLSGKRSGRSTGGLPDA